MCKGNFTVNMITVSEEAVGRRIDNFLSSYLKGVPKDKIYRILRKGEIRVNKKRIKWIYRLNLGDVIRIPPIYGGTVSEKTLMKLPEVIVKKLRASVLYEDAYLIILNKPAGIAVHGGSGLSFSVIDGLRILRPDLDFLELVHRLDRDTSGVLLLAKSQLILMDLHKQLRLKKIKKEYLALVFGKCNFYVKTVIVPLLKETSPSGYNHVTANLATGKDSKTYFVVKERFVSSTLVKITPITGRTHQIRVHAKYMGNPIAFDKRYGNILFNKEIKFSGLNRLFLHASKLEFFHLNKNRKFLITAPMDEVLLNCLSYLRRN